MKSSLNWHMRNGDLNIIEEYERFYLNVWPEIEKSIRSSGITVMQINRFLNRLCMMIGVSDDFSFEKSRYGRREFKGSGIVKYVVEIPAGSSGFRAWREVGGNEKDF